MKEFITPFLPFIVVLFIYLGMIKILVHFKNKKAFSLRVTARILIVIFVIGSYMGITAITNISFFANQNDDAWTAIIVVVIMLAVAYVYGPFSKTKLQ